LEDDIKEKLGRLPETLEQSYREVYAAIQSSGTHAARLADTVLQCLLCALELMTPNQVAALASLSSGSVHNEAEILDVCADFVDIDRSQQVRNKYGGNMMRIDVLRFAHLSVREFLEFLGREERSIFALPNAHAFLAETCMLHVFKSIDPGALQPVLQRIPHVNRSRVLPGSEQRWLRVLATLDSSTNNVVDFQQSHEGQGNELNEERVSPQDFPGYDAMGKYAYSCWPEHASLAGKDLCRWPLEDMIAAIVNENANGAGSLFDVWATTCDAMFDLGHASVKCSRIHGQDQIERRVKSARIAACVMMPINPIWVAAAYNIPIILDLCIKKDGIASLEVISECGLRPIHVAANYGHESFVQDLLRAGAIASVPGKDHYQTLPIHLAARKGHTETVRLLLNASPESVDAREEDGTTPIIEAVEGLHLNTTRLLLSRGADVTLTRKDFLFERDYYYQTPLSIVASVNSHDTNVMSLLLDHAAKIGIKFTDRSLALDYSEESDSKLMLLLKDGLTSADLNHRFMDDFLVKAHVVSCMLKAGVDLNVKNRRGRTALHYAAEFDFRSHLIPQLIKAGASISPRDEWNETPFDIAVKSTNSAIMEILLNNGVFEAIGRGHERTALLSALHREYGDVTLRKLYEIERDILSRRAHTGPECQLGHDGRAPLETGLVMEKPTLFDRKGRFGTLLHNAEGKKTLDVILEYDGPMYINDRNDGVGGTPVMSAVIQNNPGKLERLMAAGADISLQNNHGQTPLNKAVWCGHTFMVKAILEIPEGLATLSVPDNDGLKPVDTAKKKSPSAAMIMLLEEAEQRLKEPTEPLPHAKAEDKLQLAPSEGLARLTLEEE
jgi:ankyrin repeat protein